MPWRFFGSPALGISWPALPNALATTLTLIVVAASIALVLQRAAARDSRVLSRFQDYALPLFIVVPFLSGFLVMHPGLNPFDYEPTLLVHVMSGNLVLVLIPLTKLSHMALLPSVQLISEAAWHWPSHSGSRVGEMLGKQGDPV